MNIIDYIKFVIAKGLKIVLHPPAFQACEIDVTSKVGPASELSNCHIDRYSYVGSYCFIVNTEIGKFCSIADRCSIGGAAHQMEYVSTSPVFNDGRNILKKNFSSLPGIKTPRTVIGNDVWIGQGAFIKAGICIGSGAVIGMGAVVTKDIGPYEVWAGNPAKMIRKRFSDKMISDLINSQWWDAPDENLKASSDCMNDVELFIEQINSMDVQ